MLRVIVHVKKRGEEKGCDLEIPAEVPSSQLSKLIAKALGWPPYPYSVRVEPPGRLLRVQETLAEAGLWDGTHLILQGIPEAAFLESDSGRRYPLTENNMFLGRSTSKAIPEGLVNLGKEPQGNTVSRQHAQVVYHNGSWKITIKQKNEKNTWLNQNTIRAGFPHEIADGDCLQLGGVILHMRTKRWPLGMGMN